MTHMMLCWISCVGLCGGDGAPARQVRSIVIPQAPCSGAVTRDQMTAGERTSLSTGHEPDQPIRRNPAAPAQEARNSTLAVSRSGADLLGKPLELEGLRWINTPGREPVTLRGKVTLLRWWTHTCPYCAASLPAMSKLRQAFGERGFQCVAVFHPKPPRTVAAATIEQEAAKRRYTGPLAADPDWSVLKKNYLDRHPDLPTSVSFLIDKKGRVRYVHPGPAFHPSQDSAKTQENRDYQDIRQAIESLLGEQ